jgi:archaetidylinositol phosphate synthase
MPARVNSDHLSVIGFVGMFMAGLCYAASKQNPQMLYLVNLFLVVNWFGDSLDGTLARYRDRQRPRYGFYVDHIIDTFGALFLIGGLAISGYMSERVAALLLAVFFMLAINSYLAAYALGIFRLSHWKMGPTEMRLLLCVGNIFLLNHSHAHILGHRYLLYDIGGVIAIIGMALMLIVSSIKNTHALYNAERLS